MGLFEFFSKINHPSQKDGWIETEAYFTGKCEKAASGRPGHYIPAGYNEYQIRYYTAEGERSGWYVFYPLPDPDPESIRETRIRIRYRKSRPWVFEAVSE